MRIVGQERSDVSPSELETDEAETAYSAIFLGSVNGPSLIGQREDAGSFVDSYPGGEAPQVGNDSPQSQSEPDAVRRPIAAAMSWLATCVIEGFAAYGEAMYFVDPREVIDRQDLERNLPARDRHENEERNAGGDDSCAHDGDSWRSAQPTDQRQRQSHRDDTRREPSAAMQHPCEKPLQSEMTRESGGHAV